MLSEEYRKRTWKVPDEQMFRDNGRIDHDFSHLVRLEIKKPTVGMTHGGIILAGQFSPVEMQHMLANIRLAQQQSWEMFEEAAEKFKALIAFNEQLATEERPMSQSPHGPFRNGMSEEEMKEMDRRG